MGFLAGTTYLAGPIVALLVVGILALVLRWTYGTQRDPAALRKRVVDDYGLLRPVATVTSIDDANALRAVLSDASIRSTAAPRSDGTVTVLVFPADLDAARHLTGPNL